MTKGLGSIHLPPELYSIVKTKSDKDNNKKEPDKPENYEKIIYNSESYITEFNRLIDPVIIAILYGLYKSKELPPNPETSIKLSDEWGFGVDISNYRNIFNHLLFCLWVNKNGYPEESENIPEYRKKLYDFIENLLDNEYFENVLIPYYLQQASEEENGLFLYRIKESGFLKFENSTFSPEYLALDFQNAQEEFEDEIIAPLLERM